MSIKAHIKTAIVDRIAASRGPLNRLRATRYGLDRRPTLELYYEAGDPHSHLCAQWLRKQSEGLRVRVRIRVVPETVPEAYPEADKQRAMALQDAIRLAPALGLHFPPDATLPSAADRALAAATLLRAGSDLRTWLNTEDKLAARLFSGQVLHETPASPEIEQALARNAQRRARLGHYLPGMWQFNGDWFWGLDRMGHLQEALRPFAGWDASRPMLSCDVTRYALPRLNAPQGPLEFFFSFRSPYSYLAATTLRRQLADLPVPLAVRPVLPMAMRGMKIPRAKGFYIVRDVYREAQRQGYAFGHIADPIGAGAERCLRVFTLAQGTEQQLAFCQEAARAAWSEAIDLSSDAGLEKVCERSGIAWAQARELLAQEPDLAYAEANRQALFEAGAWGVPTFRLGDFVCWGNDRMPMLGELLRRHFSESRS